MSEFRVVDVFEQDGTYDGGYKASVDPHLLMTIVNHRAAESDEEVADMSNPKRLAVRVTIETKEVPMPPSE